MLGTQPMPPYIRFHVKQAPRRAFPGRGSKKRNHEMNELRDELARSRQELHDLQESISELMLDEDGGHQSPFLNRSGRRGAKIADAVATPRLPHSVTPDPAESQVIIDSICKKPPFNGRSAGEVAALVATMTAVQFSSWDLVLCQGADEKHAFWVGEIYTCTPPTYAHICICIPHARPLGER